MLLLFFLERTNNFYLEWVIYIYTHIKIKDAKKPQKYLDNKRTEPCILVLKALY